MLVAAIMLLPTTAAAATQARLIVGFEPGETASEQTSALRAAGLKGLTVAQVRSEDVPRLRAASVEVAADQLALVRKRLLARADVSYVEVDHVARALWTPGDLQLGEQWALPKLGAPTAWDTARGSGVLIAVIDTGVSYIHPDLQGKVELGWDFVSNDADPMDEQGHGTHVAGIAAGVTDNAAGIAGMAPNARILAVRALDQQGAGYYSWIASAITSSADKGAKVINLSLGGPEGSQLLEQAVEYAAAHGAVVTCASGNESAAAVGFPARYDGCLAVGATTQDDALASFSNQGPGLDVVAPGADILSTTRGGGYEAWSGTSMATPYASGVAALLVSQGLNRMQVTQAMAATASDLGAPGYDTSFGHGRLDAAAAVAHAATLPATTPDTQRPVVSNVDVAKPVRSGPVTYAKKWRKKKTTRWKRVGVTGYRGRYSWRRVSTKRNVRIVTQFRMRNRRVLRRTITYRRVKVARPSSNAVVPVQVHASDDRGVDRVGLVVDGVWVATDWNGADGWNFRFACRAGQHRIVVHAFDARDNAATVELQRTLAC